MTLVDYCVSDNSGGNSVVPAASSAAEAETGRLKLRGIWSLAETAASSDRNVSTATINNSYFYIRPDTSLIPYLANMPAAY